MAALDARFPTPSLRPDTAEAQAEAQAEARAIEARFDDGFVPRMRRAALAALMTDPDYMCSLFGEGSGPLASRIFRAMFPVSRIVIAKGNGIDGPAAIEDGKRACGEALDFVARATARTGHLVGASFTHADLGAAAGLAMVFPPPGSPMEGHGTRPAASQALIDAHAGHPALAWLAAIYARHRPPIRELDGPSPY